MVAVTVEQGGFGAEAAAPAARLILSQWFGVKKKFVRRDRRTTPMSTALDHADPATPTEAAARRAPARAGLPLDPLLLLAVLGLVRLLAGDAVGGHARRHPRHPHYYVDRQAGVRGRRARPDARARQPLRLLAAARAEVRALRLHDRLDPARARRSARPRAARSAGSTSRSSASSPPSSASCCWSWRCRRFVVDRIRRLQRPRHDGAGDAAGAGAGGAGHAQPDLGSAWSTSSSRWPSCSSPAPAGSISRRSSRSSRGHRARARRRSRGRRARAQALPGGPPDGVPEPVRQPSRAGLPAEPVADRDRRRPEDRPRRDDATQTTLNFLPEHHTDFIFAVVGERYGFVGAALVLSLYALLIWRGLRILTMAKNLYGALIAGGIVAMLMFQVFVNVGHDHRDHAHHRRPAAADVLWRLFGPRHLPGARAAAVDLRPRRATRRGRARAERSSCHEKETHCEKASTGQRRPRRDPRRDARGDRAGPAAAQKAGRRRRSRRGGQKPPRATASPSCTSSAAAPARSSATSTRGGSTTSSPASRPPSSTSAWRRTASCTSTRSCCRASRRPPRPRRRQGQADRRPAQARARRSSSRWSRTRSRRRARACRCSWRSPAATWSTCRRARASASRAGSTTRSATGCASEARLDLSGGGAIVRTAAARRQARGLRARAPVPPQAPRGAPEARQGGEGAGDGLPGGRPVGARRARHLLRSSSSARSSTTRSSTTG